MYALLKHASSKSSNLITQSRHFTDIPKDAFAVVVGGGIVGTSVAYHLTQRGVRDVVLLEKGTLASGTTHHSPGLVSSAHPVHRYKPFLALSVDLYARIEKETGEKVDFAQPGTLRLITSESRLNEFRRYTARDYYQEGDPAKTSLIDADEVRELAPIVDTKKLLGALYTSGDGYINARGLTRALAKGAQNGGATIIEGCPTILHVDSANGDWLIKFEDGRELATRNLINAAGLWAREFAGMANIKVPLVIVEHQYASIGPISEVGELASLPAIVDHDSTFYLRRDGDRILFGGFEPHAFDVVIREDWMENMPKECYVEAQFDRLKRAYNRACELIPALRNVPVEAHASAFTMMPDGYPLVGPINNKQNYWLQAGYFDGVSSGGGMGKYLADWIVDGEPPSELFDTDANRFARWASPKYLTDKCRETYSMFYNWSYTNRLAGRPTNRVSGIYSQLLKDGCFYLFRNGWEVAESFAREFKDKLPNMIREYETVINKFGVIDLSWRGKIEVRGKDSTSFMDYVLASAPPAFGEVKTAVMLTTKGNIIAALEVFHYDPYLNEYIIITDPEREARDVIWLKRAAAEMGAEVDITAVSEYLASIALVGPRSREVLEEMTKSDLGFDDTAARLMRLGNVPVVAVRSTALTGRLSYELYHSRGDTLKLYNAIKEVDEAHDMVNFGQSTLNIMRIESGYKIWGRELTLNTNPYECGISHLVDLNKPNFIGKASALELANKKYDQKLALLACEPLNEDQGWESIPRRMEVIRKDGSEDRVGQITSGTYSVRLHRPLAFAWVHSDITPDDVLWVDVGGSRIQGKIYDATSVQDIEAAADLVIRSGGNR